MNAEFIIIKTGHLVSILIEKLTLNKPTNYLIEKFVF
jgi:hypothetical protein